MLFSPGYPGFLRGVASSGPGEFVVTTANGQVARYRPDSNESDGAGRGFRPALRHRAGARRSGRRRRTRDRTSAVDPARRRRGAGLRSARSGWCRHRPRRRVPGRRSRGGWSSWTGRARLVDDLQRPAGHPGARRCALHRRRGRQGADRVRSGHRDAAHHRVESAGRRPARCDAQAAARNGAVLRAARAVRRHRRGARRHAVRLGRCGGQRAGVAPHRQP